jgi:hypothetical protein
MSWSENGSKSFQMRMAFQGCCFRVEVELFAPTLVVGRQGMAPRRGRFQIERRLRRRLAHVLGQNQLPRPGSEG